jgi:hypothetical protein
MISIVLLILLFFVIAFKRGCDHKLIAFGPSDKGFMRCKCVRCHREFNIRLFEYTKAPKTPGISSPEDIYHNGIYD